MLKWKIFETPKIRVTVNSSFVVEMSEFTVNRFHKCGTNWKWFFNYRICTSHISGGISLWKSAILKYVCFQLGELRFHKCLTQKSALIFFFIFRVALVTLDLTLIKLKFMPKWKAWKICFWLKIRYWYCELKTQYFIWDNPITFGSF